MISEQAVEKELNGMREAAAKYAQAKANRTHLEQFRKSKKAILFQEAPDEMGQGSDSRRATVADRENYAYSHPEYIELLDALKIAVEEEERLKCRMTAAELMVEVWRTQNANARRQDQAHR